MCVWASRVLGGRASLDKIHQSAEILQHGVKSPSELRVKGSAGFAASSCLEKRHDQGC